MSPDDATTTRTSDLNVLSVRVFPTNTRDRYTWLIDSSSSYGQMRAMDKERLTEIFRLAGATDPEGWAGSEIREGIPQLARYLFLRAAWRGVLPDGDASWIDAHLVQNGAPDDPGAGLKPALARIMERGVDRGDLTEVVRVMQWHVLAHICQILDDPYGAVDDLQMVPELADYKFGWGLVELDEDGKVGRSIDSLHESVLDTDPSGREMRPGR
jgi:hypothetical protein